MRAVIARPQKPPWVLADLPFPEPVDTWPGTLLSWRWIDPAAQTWCGVVRYCRDGLLYEHAVHGDLISVEPEAQEREGKSASVADVTNTEDVRPSQHTATKPSGNARP